MATFDVGSGFLANFDTTPIATADGILLARTEHLIRFSVDRVPDGFENFIGSFTYTDTGQPVGVVTEFRLTTGDTLIYRIGDGDLDTLELLRIAGQNDPQAFLRYIFRAADRLTGAELTDLIRGYAGNDTLIGRGGNDMLFGGPGCDKLHGGYGDDWLDGGRGRNALVGGPGDDSFVLRGDHHPDVIQDFREGDRIGLALAGLGHAGVLDPDAFHCGPTAETPEQRLLYDSDSGWLRYAREGSESAQVELIARLADGHAHLDAGDFFLL